MIGNQTSEDTEVWVTVEKAPPSHTLQKRPLHTKRDAIYCQEVGVEGLHQSYIKVHGLCRLPRAHKCPKNCTENVQHCHRSLSEEENAEHRHNKDCLKKAQDYHSKECIENAKHCHDTVCLEKCHRSLDRIKPFQHCQKGQYMLVRLPPHCKVRWKHHTGYQDKFRRYHSTESWLEQIMKVRFN